MHRLLSLLRHSTLRHAKKIQQKKGEIKESLPTLFEGLPLLRVLFVIKKWIGRKQGSAAMSIKRTLNSESKYAKNKVADCRVFDWYVNTFEFSANLFPHAPFIKNKLSTRIRNIAGVGDRKK